MRLLYITGLAAALGVGAPAADAGSEPCGDPGYRQFDFWVGHWNVSEDGEPAGTNRVERRFDGCVLSEHWSSHGCDMTGTSLNTYDPAHDRWHQTWVDNRGTLLLLEGGLEGGSMVMQGTRPAANGQGSVTHRITWTPRADGSVRQYREMRRAGGEWATAFDGLYRRAAAGAKAQ